MRLHKYRSYRQYVRIQTKKNKKRIDATYATPEVMNAVADYLREHLPDATFGICHGAKHGWEVDKLRERLGIEVLGTDISPTAKKFKHMIQWDFHEINEEWIDRVDFIYSNTLDHSYDPELCLERWAQCLRPGGLCFIEWSPWHGENHSTADDPFGASLDEYRQLLSKSYRVRAEIELERSETDIYQLDRVILVAERPGS